jgi:hypothetical protein
MKLSPLTIQILILVASFLFYRILRQGFDSWKALLIDFGIVLFLFGLQYFLQTKQNEQAKEPLDDSFFPSGALSSYFGTNFPSKIALGTKSPMVSSSGRNGILLEMDQDYHFEPRMKKILNLNKKYTEGKKEMWRNEQILIPETGFYMIQFSCHTDVVPFSAKLSLMGRNTFIEKSIHHGENSFIIYLEQQDKIKFEVENTSSKCMMLKESSIVMVKV